MVTTAVQIRYHVTEKERATDQNRMIPVRKCDAEDIERINREGYTILEYLPETYGENLHVIDFNGFHLIATIES